MTECQRLISISLGKIAASRSNRSGINLHKNLMVSCVLNRARTAFYEESLAWYNSRQSVYEPPVMDYRDNNTNGYESDTDVSEAECESSSGMVNAHCTSPVASHYTTTFVPSGHSYHEVDVVDDKENIHPSCQNMESDHYIVTKPAEKIDPFDCDSDPADGDSHKKSYTVLTSPTKRKLSEVEAAVESIQPKRQKCSDCFDADCNHSVTPQAEQISTLVNYFNSGFTSLLSVPENGPCAGESDQRGNGSCWSASQGRPLLDSFESVSPPVIVMTV